jgi:hypothetical protein
MAATVKKTVVPVKTVTGKTISSPKQEVHQPSSADLAFGKENYILMIIGIVLIIVGFILMAGGKMEDPAAFNPEIFSFRRITLAPVVVMLGFAIEVYAIVKKSKE